MKYLILFIAFNICSIIYAQNVGINTDGTTADPSAGLDVKYTDKGVLIPRVALSARNLATPITAPATSLLVYNSATAGVPPNNVYPGYYFWDGTQWVRIAIDGEYWRVDGNLGTTAPSVAIDLPIDNNFIGTRDAQAISFATNNLQRMRIMSDNNQQIRVGIGTLFAGPYPSGTTPTLLHVFDGGSTVNDFGLIQIGAAKGSIGQKVGELNFHSNLAATDRRTSSISSTIEDVSGTLPSGNLIFSTNLAGTTTEKMRLIANGNLGINTDTPTQKLDIDGQIRIRGGNPGIGKVLTSDANGTATWEDPISGGGCGGVQSTSATSFTVTPGVCVVSVNWGTSTGTGRIITLPNAVNHGGETLVVYLRFGAGSSSFFRSATGSQIQAGTAAPATDVAIGSGQYQKHMFISDGVIWIKVL